MSSPYLGIAHMAAAQTQKEVTANASTDALDSAMNAVGSFSLVDATTARTMLQADMASAFVLKFTGPLTAARNVIVPAIARFFAVFNGSTGGFALTVKTASGSGISVSPTAGYIPLYCDGVNVVSLGAAAGGGGGSTFPAPLSIPLAPGAAGNFTVSHGLGATPKLVLIQMNSGGSIWFQPGTQYDATNIYLVASDPGATGSAEVWG